MVYTIINLHHTNSPPPHPHKFYHEKGISDILNTINKNVEILLHMITHANPVITPLSWDHDGNAKLFLYWAHYVWKPLQQWHIPIHDPGIWEKRPRKCRIVGMGRRDSIKWTHF